MNFQKYTIKSQEAVQLAQEIALSNANQAVEPQHLLAALVRDTGGVVVPILQKIGANLEYVKTRIDEAIGTLPKISGAGASNQFIGQPLTQVFDLAIRDAQALKDEYVSTEHLLLAIAQMPQSPAGRILADQGVTKEQIYSALKEIRGKQRVTDQTPEDKYQALSKFGRAERHNRPPILRVAHFGVLAQIAH